MKYGPFYNRAPLLLLCAICCVIWLPGCKNTRQTIKTTQVGESTHYGDSVRFDSFVQLDSAGAERQDTTEATTTSSGVVLVERDSVGRPERIAWTVTQTLQALTHQNAREESRLHELNAMQHKESSKAVDSVDEKKEETTEEINTAISLENIIGPGLLAIVFLYLIYVLFADVIWPWIKQKRNR